MTRSIRNTLLALIATMLLSSSVAKAGNACSAEMQQRANTTALSMLGAKVLKAADNDLANIFANPDRERFDVVIDALVKAVETVTKRPVYSFVRNYVADEAFGILNVALADRKKMAAVEDLLDKDERAVLEQENKAKNQPQLTRAANLMVNAVLTWCNRPGGSTAP